MLMACVDTENLIAKFDYYATESHELTILQGERLTLLDDSLQWWQVVNRQGEVGYVPSNYVRPLKQTLLGNLMNTLTRRKLTNAKQQKCFTPSIHRRHAESSCIRQLSMPAVLYEHQNYSNSIHNSKENDTSKPFTSTLTENKNFPITPEKIKKLKSQTYESDMQLLQMESDKSATMGKMQIKHTYTEGSSAPVPLVPTSQVNNSNAESNAVSNERTENFTCRVVQPYEARLADELSIRPGDRIQVYKRSADGWWFGTLLDRGRPTVTGWFPSNLVSRDLSNNPVSSPTANVAVSRDPVPDSTMLVNHQSTPIVETRYLPRETVLTLYSYVRNNLEELSFQANELLAVVHRPGNQSEWWRCRNGQGEIGWVPRNYVALMPPQTGKTDCNLESAALASRSPDRLDVRPMRRTPAYNVDNELLRLSYAKRSKLAKLFLTKPWFWGSLSRSDCEFMLRLFSVPGEFVIRDSESDPGNLTITMNTRKRNRNFKVILHVGRYHIGPRVFNTMDDLIHHYQTHFIFTDENQQFRLTQPFVYPGTPELEPDRSEYTTTFRPYDATSIEWPASPMISTAHIAHPSPNNRNNSNSNGLQTNR